MDAIKEDKLICNAKAELQRDISALKLLAVRRRSIYPIFFDGGLKRMLMIGTNGFLNNLEEDGKQEIGINLLGPNRGKCFFFADFSGYSAWRYFQIVSENGIRQPNGGIISFPPQISRGLKETDCVKIVANGGENESVPALQMMDGCKSYIWRHDREGGEWKEDRAIFNSISYPIRDYETSYALGLNLSNLDQFGYLVSGNNILCLIAKDTNSSYTAHYTVNTGDYSRVAWHHVNNRIYKEYARNNFLYGIKSGIVEYFETTQFDSYDYPCRFITHEIYTPDEKRAPAVDIKTALIGAMPIVFILDMKDQVWYVKPSSEVRDEEREWEDTNFHSGQKQRGSITRSVPAWDEPVLIASGIFDITLGYEDSPSPVLYCTKKGAKVVFYMHAWALYPEFKFTTSHMRIPEVDIKNRPNLDACEEEVYNTTIVNSTKNADGEEIALSGAPFTIYSQVPQMLTVNGREIVVNSLVSYSSYTDMNGCVMVASRCDKELGCPSFGFLVKGMKEGSIFEIMPAGDVEQTLENIRPDDLKNATLNSSYNGPKRKLLEGKNISDEKLSQAVSEIHNIMKKDADTEKRIHESGQCLVNEKANTIMRTRPFLEMVPENRYPDRRWGADGTRRDELSDNFLLDWLDRAGNWAQDLFEKPEVQEIAGGVATVLKITGVDVVLRGLYSVGRYLVNAVVKVLETVLNLNWKEIFEWLANLLNYDNIIAHKHKLMEFANSTCDNLVQMVDDYCLPLLTIQQLASVKAKEWIKKIFAEFKERYGIQNKPREKHGYLSTFFKKLMEILGFIPGLIMKLVKQLMDELSELGILPSLSWDSSAFMAKVNELLAAAGISVADDVLQLLEDAVGIVWDFFTCRSTANNALGEAIDLLRDFLLAIINTIDQAINLVIQIGRLVVSHIKEVLNAKIYIPGISQIYRKICGATEDFSILEVFCFIAAIPMSVITNASKFPGLEKDITFDLTQINPPVYSPPGKAFKDAVDSSMIFLGGNPYYAGGGHKKFIRLRITGIRDRDANMVQLRSVRFYKNDLEVVPISVTNPDGRNPDNEKVENLLDTSNSKKWLQFDWKSKNESILIFEFPSEVEIDRYELQTANDEEGRDPTSWELHRSVSRYFLPVDSELLESRSGVLMSYERNKINSFSVTHAPISDTFESAHEVMAKAPSLKSARLMQQTSSAPTLTDSQRVEWQELIDSKSDAYRYRWGGIVSAVGQFFWFMNDTFEMATQYKCGWVDLLIDTLFLIDFCAKGSMYFTKSPKNSDDIKRDGIASALRFFNILDIAVDFLLDILLIKTSKPYQSVLYISDVDPSATTLTAPNTLSVDAVASYNPTRPYGESTLHKTKDPLPILRFWSDYLSPLCSTILGSLWVIYCPEGSYKSVVGWELFVPGIMDMVQAAFRRQAGPELSADSTRLCIFIALDLVMMCIKIGWNNTRMREEYYNACDKRLKDFENSLNITDNIKEKNGVGLLYNPNKQ